MTLPLDLGKTSVKGSSNLFFGLVISNVILAIAAIVVGRLLGSDLYGLYSLSSIPATFLGLCLGLGVRSGIVKYSAQFNQLNETEKVRDIIVSGLLFITLSGSIFAVLSFLISPWLADFFGRPYATFLVKVFSLSILTDALVLATQSVFIGLDKTQYYSSVLIFQAILKTLISIILVLTGFGPLGAVAGQTIASLAASVFGMSIVYFFIIKKLTSNFGELRLLSNLKMLVNFGFPLYVRNLVVTGVGIHFLNFLMIIYASNVLIGNYKAATNFQVLMSFFAIPISAVLLPTFSKLEFDSNPKSLETMFVSSVKYTSLILVPAAAALIVLSEPLVSTFYGQTYTLAPLYLSLSVLTFLYAAFGQYSIPHLLSSQGETKKSMILGISNVALVLPLALILVPAFQIIGLVVSLTISGFPTIIFGSWWVKKLYNFSINWNQAGRILACSFITGILTFATIRYLALSNLLELTIGFLIFSFSFLILAPLIGVINPDDISNLRTLFSETGKITALLEIPFRLLSKFANLRTLLERKRT